MAALDFDFWVQKNIMGQRYDVMIHHDVKDKHWVAAPLTMNLVEQEGTPLDPSFAMTYASAQKLMDELWGAGVRPSNGAGSAGELAAVRYHLEDLRTIVNSYVELKK